MTKLHSVQLLRFVASFLVVVTHFHSAGKYVPENTSELESMFAGFGQSGVDIFFVISGYIMYTKLSNSECNFSYAKSFLVNRALRIVPMYWIFTTLSVFVMIAFQRELDVYHVLKSYAFVPTENALGEPHPLLVVGWTLVFEMYFYGVLAIIMATRIRTIEKRLLAVPLFMVFIAFVVATNDFSNAVVFYYTHTIIIEFILGLLVAYLLEKINVKSSIGLWTLLAIGVVWFSLPLFFDKGAIDRVFVWGVSASIVIFSLVSLERQGKISINSKLSYLGDSSYSLYLSHFFVLNAMGLAWQKYASSVSADLLFVLFPLVCLLFSVVTYELVEKKLTIRIKSIVVNNKIMTV